MVGGCVRSGGGGFSAGLLYSETTAATQSLDNTCEKCDRKKQKKNVETVKNCGQLVTSNCCRLSHEGRAKEEW